MTTEKQDEVIKTNLKAIVTHNIRNYIRAKHILMPLLMKEPKKSCTKKKKCNGCKAEEAFAAMDHYQGIVREACKAMEVLFNEKIDVEAIVESFGESLSEAEFTPKKSGKIILPENAPEDIQKVAKALKDVLLKNGMSGDMEIIDMKAENHDIDPANYENFGEYLKAVDKARKINKDIKKGKVTAEEVLTDAVTTDAQEHPEEIKGKA
jgi:hypothetical protein